MRWSSAPVMSLTRDLERLDAIRITDRTPHAFGPALNTSTCSERELNRRRPPKDLVETWSWQPISADRTETLVFSAYYDIRWQPQPLIQIIGITSRLYLGVLACQIWYMDLPQPLLSKASSQVLHGSPDRRSASTSVLYSFYYTY